MVPHNVARAGDPLVSTAFYPHRLTLLGPSNGFGLTQRVTQVGPVTVGDITYQTDVNLGPSLDTTIFAISNAVSLFANNPDQWEPVREDLIAVRKFSQIPLSPLSPLSPAIHDSFAAIRHG